MPVRRTVLLLSFFAYAPHILERQDSLALGMVRVIGDTTLHRGASSGTSQRFVPPLGIAIVSYLFTS